MRTMRLRKDESVCCFCKRIVRKHERFYNRLTKDRDCCCRKCHQLPFTELNLDLGLKLAPAICHVFVCIALPVCVGRFQG